MATTILFVLFVTVLLRAAFSLPISQNVKPVLSNSAQDVELIERKVFNLKTVLRLDENIERVKSLDSVPIDGGVKRTKRETIVAHSCPVGWRWLEHFNRCVTLEQYKQATGDDDDDE